MSENKQHPYAEILRAIADGKKIQTKLEGEWIDRSYPMALQDISLNRVDQNSIRIKPKTIRIGEYDVPEPQRSAKYPPINPEDFDSDSDLCHYFYAWKHAKAGDDSGEKWQWACGQIQRMMRAYVDAFHAMISAAPQPPAVGQEPQSAEWVDKVMSQAQVFASAWSLVDGRLDDGSMMETAEQEKAALRAILTAAPQAPAPTQKPVEFGSAAEFSSSDDPHCKDGGEACINCLMLGECLLKSAHGIINKAEAK